MAKYRMALNHHGKTIFVDLCCFCKKAQITSQCVCLLTLPASEQCAQFECCQSVADRVDMLTNRLPKGYGSARTTENKNNG